MIAMSLGHPTAWGAGGDEKTSASAQPLLSQKERSIAPIAAVNAVGEMAQLNAALSRGLDAGLTLSDAKEILVQLYAYTGFPRSLSAQLRQVAHVLAEAGQADAARRTRAALERHLAGPSR